MTDLTNIDFNEQFTAAYHLLENTPKNVFITGRAGTGKSTLLQYFREHTSKDIAVLAPTGVAAVNVKGQTIHSFFHFKPNVTPEGVKAIRTSKADKELYQSLDALVIDEISMVRADLIDCMDAFLRGQRKRKDKPFGGVQMIFIGDLYQLPPVVTKGEEELFRDIYVSPYFFAAKVMTEFEMEFIDLEKIYRQQEDEFIALLNAIRDDSATDEQLARLNRRYQPGFKPPPEDFYVYLTTTNAIAERINQEQLEKSQGRTYHYLGKVVGQFEKRNLPTQEFLDLKIGAQVMLLNNDAIGRWINGSIGKIHAIAEDLTATDIISVELEGGRQVEVTPFTWDMYHFYFNQETERIESQSAGSFTQYPLKLAWAVTIHKSQGKTFHKVIVDIGSGAFAHGQTYVALSRCTTLDGLVLKKPIRSKDVLLDPRVAQFMTHHQDWSYRM
jgi:ATP-dependent DNA helicase PIF1